MSASGRFGDNLHVCCSDLNCVCGCTQISNTKFTSPNPKSLGLTMSDVQDPNLGLSFRYEKKIGKLAIIYLVKSV